MKRFRSNWIDSI